MMPSWTAFFAPLFPIFVVAVNCGEVMQVAPPFQDWVFVSKDFTIEDLVLEF